MQFVGLDTSSTEAQSFKIHYSLIHVSIYRTYGIQTIASKVFILKGYLFMGLYNPYWTRKAHGLCIPIWNRRAHWAPI